MRLRAERLRESGEAGAENARGRRNPILLAPPAGRVRARTRITVQSSYALTEMPEGAARTRPVAMVAVPVAIFAMPGARPVLDMGISRFA